MSWSNPTPQEAEDNYYYYKNRYNNAASEKALSERREANYNAQRTSTINQMNSVSSQKLNFEKRLEQIGVIIKMLEGSTGINDVPSIIARGIQSVKRTDESYQTAIRLGGVAPAAFASIFDVKTVTGDANSSSALSKYKSEYARLQQAIADLQSQLASLSAAVDSLNSAIRSCNAEQASLRSSMLSSAYEMNHYKKYMD